MCIFRGGYEEEVTMCIKEDRKYVVNWIMIGAILGYLGFLVFIGFLILAAV